MPALELTGWAAAHATTPRPWSTFSRSKVQRRPALAVGFCHSVRLGGMDCSQASAGSCMCPWTSNPRLNLEKHKLPDLHLFNHESRVLWNTKFSFWQTWARVIQNKHTETESMQKSEIFIDGYIERLRLQGKVIILKRKNKRLGVFVCFYLLLIKHFFKKPFVP